MELDQDEQRMAEYMKNAKIDNTLDNRLRFRQCVLLTQNINQHVSGVLLNDEGLTQRLMDAGDMTGRSLPEVLQQQGILVGCNVTNQVRGRMASCVRYRSVGETCANCFAVRCSWLCG